jgi:hypothetical protein
MSRRTSLSVALALATLVTFSLVSMSVRAGLFGLGGDGSGAHVPAAQAETVPNGAQQSQLSDPAVSDSSSPGHRVETQYVYYDDGTYGPAPNANGDAGFTADQTSETRSDDQSRGGATPTPGRSSNGTPRPTPVHAFAPTPAPQRPATEPPEQIPLVEPTPTPTATPHGDLDDDDDGTPVQTAHPTEEPHETEEPQETEEPDDDAYEPHETEEPHDDEPSETEEPYDDDSYDD